MTIYNTKAATNMDENTSEQHELNPSAKQDREPNTAGPKTAELKTSKSKMDKRKIVKDDGRTLIFYSFGKSPSGQEETK